MSGTGPSRCPTGAACVVASSRPHPRSFASDMQGAGQLQLRHGHAARACRTIARPWENVPVCVLRPPAALTSRTCPRRTSNSDPTGTLRRLVRLTNRFDPRSRTNTTPPAGATFTETPATGGGTAPSTPQSTFVPASTFSRVTPEPSAFAVKSSSCSGPPTSCANASFVPSGDHATSHTSARFGTRRPGRRRPAARL